MRLRTLGVWPPQVCLTQSKSENLDPGAPLVLSKRGTGPSARARPDAEGGDVDTMRRGPFRLLLESRIANNGIRDWGIMLGLEKC